MNYNIYMYTHLLVGITGLDHAGGHFSSGVGSVHDIGRGSSDGLFAICQTGKLATCPIQVVQ